MSRTNLSTVVSRQLPEHIREDYPTFVAFVEAYYEYLESQGVDFSTIRDIDNTLDSFVSYFKKELAYNLPSNIDDERFLLHHIKDQYLAKGSQASYKLLFRLLFNKDVEIVYPGRSMLRVSDGRWNQEISLFVKVDYGNPADIEGKLVDIETSTRTLRVLVDRTQDIIGEVDRIVLIDPNRQVYEVFLDRRFFGDINPGDKLRYLDKFQASILPTTRNISISQPGKNFRVGQVFELRSGTGTGALLKVTSITDTGGIKYAEIIKFGIGYTADFAVSILASNAFTSIGTNVTTSSSTLVQQNTFSSDGPGTLSADPLSNTIIGSGTNFGQVGGPAVNDELWTTDSTPKFIGIVKEIVNPTSLSLIDNPSNYDNSITTQYTGSFTFRNIRSVGTLYNPNGDQAFTFETNLGSRTLGFDEQGYINIGDYVTHEFVDGTYSGSLIREFSLNFRNAQVEANEPAIIRINLGALVKYPGYFETNNGFLDDSIYIQDSKYYQAFSYVLKIDERLSSYSSAVKTMLHPAGMALFSEFNITNSYDLGVSLQSLISSLGLGIKDQIDIETEERFNFLLSKILSTSLLPPVDNITSKTVGKGLTSSTELPVDNVITRVTKSVTSSQPILDGSLVFNSFKTLQTDYNQLTDSLSVDLEKTLTTSQAISDAVTFTHDKYVYPQEDPDILSPQDHQGYVQLNSYYGQDYIVFEDEYSVGSRQSTFNTL